MPLRFTAPQLAQLQDVVPEDAGWVFEVKYDGYRLQALVEKGRVRLLTRNGLDWTERFASIAQKLSSLPAHDAVLDGELVAFDDAGRAAFGALQRQVDAGTAARLQYVVFDLLELNGVDLKPHALTERWSLLQHLLRQAKATNRSAVRLSERLTGPPASLIGAACARQLEGVIGKRSDAPYRTGRGGGWIKVKCTGRQEFIVIGFTPPGGSRVGLGSLLLAVNDAGQLRFAGRVGSGFSDRELDGLLARLKRIERKASPLTPVPRGIPAGVRWVAPQLVAEVTFTEWTDDGHLRHPVFVGFRTDKPAADVRRERSTSVPKKSATTTSNPVVAGITITHPDRVLYPEAGVTKLDLARYLERVAPVMLPHVANRPLALVRCPEGAASECFFQKHWSGKLPDALDSVSVLQGDGKKHPHVVVQDVAGLVTLAQWGVLEIHPWGSRADNPERPDRIIFDLDPGPTVVWKAIVDSARGLAALLHELGLESWVKTSGGKGLHVVVPIARRATWDDVSRFARAVAEHMAAVAPDHFLAKASKAERHGRIFVDWLRNTRGATAVAAYSARARPAAGISQPITWRSLAKVDSGDQFTVKTPGAGRGADPWKALLASKQALSPRIFAILDHV